MARDTQKNRSEALRQKILDTALEIGLEEGFEELSVRKIINKMDYSTSIIYYHFRDKQEIIDALVKSESDWLAKRINEVLSEDNGLVKNLENAFRLITKLAINEQERFNLIVLRKYSSPKAANSPWVKYIQNDMEKSIKNGEMAPMDTYKAAFCVWSSFLGFHLMLSLQEGITEQQGEELFKVQMNIILNGILNS